jgi:hypothetical protein
VLVVFNIFISILMDSYSQARDDPIYPINLQNSFFNYLGSFRTLQRMRAVSGIPDMTQKYSDQEAASIRIQMWWNHYSVWIGNRYSISCQLLEYN